MVHLKQQLTKSNGRKWLIPIFPFLIIFMLFPYGWLEDKWPAYDRLAGFFFFFESEAGRAAGHAVLFVILGTIVLLIFPRLQQKPGLYLGFMAWIAVLQEYLQLATFKNRPVVAADIFDLAVDLVAAGLIFIVLKWLAKGEIFWARGHHNE